MGGKLKWGGTEFGSVLQLLEDTEDHYGIKVRLSIVPRPRTGYKDGCILLATCYNSAGRKMGDVEPEQALWPSKGYKSLDGAWLALLIKLHGALDEREHAEAREAQISAPEELTPLEHYIAGTF